MTTSDRHILMYHHVAPKGVLEELCPFVVFKDTFVRQMDILVAMGFKSVHLDTLFDELEAGRNAGREVVITFDDGGRELMDHAVPELQSRGLTATFFVPAGRLGLHNDWDPPGTGLSRTAVMNERDIRWLVQQGFELGSHGLTHADLSRVPTETVLMELTESRRLLEQRFDTRVRFCAFPFGEYPANYDSLCRTAGYRGACGISSPSRHSVDNPYALRRVFVHTWDTPFRFRLKMRKPYLRLLSRRDREILRRGLPNRPYTHAAA